MTEFVMLSMYATVPVHKFLFVHVTLKSKEALWDGTGENAASLNPITNVYTVLVGIFQEKNYRLPERRWSDNIQINLKIKLLNDAHWSRLAQDMYRGPAVVNTGMNFRVLHDTNRITVIPRLNSDPAYEFFS